MLQTRATMVVSFAPSAGISKSFPARVFLSKSSKFNVITSTPSGTANWNSEVLIPGLSFKF